MYINALTRDPNTMAGAGVLTVFVATVAMPAGLKGASWVLAISGTLTVG